MLLAKADDVHSYMHCWRHKTPIILRATTQWFAGMDDVPGYQGVKPTSRCARLRSAESRRHAVLSRVGQGAAARHDREPPGLDAVAAAPVGRADAVLRPQGNRRAASAHARAPRRSGEARGAGRASKRGRHSMPDELLGDDAAYYEKVKDTLDVWFDSGSTHLHRAARLAQRRERLPGRPLSRRLRPASRLVSLLAARSCMMDGMPPYRALLTHGFVVDGSGRKMSKSLGNVIAPQEVIGRTRAPTSCGCGSRRRTIPASCRFRRRS